MTPQEEVELIRIRARARERASETSRQAPQAIAPSRRGQRAPLATDAGGATANFWHGVPFAGDVSAITRGLVEAAPQALDIAPPPERPGLRGNYFNRVAGAFGRGYQTQRAGERAMREDFAERRPNAANFAQGSGAALPIALTMGAAAPEVAAATVVPRELQAFAAQTARAGVTGAAYGEVYGAGTSDGGWQDRLQAGNEAAPFGAALGLATPALVNTAGAAFDRLGVPAWRALTGAAERLPTARPNTVGSMGGNLVRPPFGRRPAIPRGPSIPPAAINRIEALADRNRMSPDAVDEAFAQARANPQGQVTADLFGDAGVRTLRPIVQAPGESGGVAREVLRDRARSGPERIMGALTRRLQVDETRAAATARLQGAYRRLSAEAYDPLWREPVTPEQHALYERDIAPMLSPDNPNQAERTVVQWAIRKAREQFQLDASNGLVRGSIDDNLPRYLHYIKMSLGERANFEAGPLRGTAGARLAGLRQLYQRFSQALDPGEGPAVIPGYRAITNEAGDYFTATRALDQGAEWLRMGGEEVTASRAGMTDFELRHARIGLADEIRHATRGGVNRNKNVAAALDDPEVQQSIAAAFDTPAQAAEFLSLINGVPGSRGAPGMFRLMENATAWNGGSPSYSNFAHGEDNIAGAVAEHGADIMRGDHGRAIQRGFRQVGNFLSNNAVERANNQAGEALLRRIDGPEAKAFSDEVVRLLRQRAATRTARDATARIGSAASGTLPRRRD